MIMLPLLLAAGLRLVPAGLSAADEKGAPFRFPEGVACGGDRAVVADTGNGRLVWLAVKGAAIAGGAEVRLPELGTPARVRLRKDGGVLSLDLAGRRVVKVSPLGKYEGAVEPKGVPPARGFAPVSFDLHEDGSIDLLDAASARVVRLDAAGAFVRQIDLPFGAQPSDIASDSRGTLFVVDAIAAVIYVAAPGAAQLTPYSRELWIAANLPATFAASPRGLLFVADRAASDIVIVAPGGSFAGKQLSLGWSPGFIDTPGQVCIDGDNLFVADSRNHRVQSFKLER
jgi:streptogramin lyase